MRALSIAMFSIYLCVSASPCVGGKADRSARVSKASAVAHAHAGGEAHGSTHHGANRHCDGAEKAANEFAAKCPCGCGGGLATANSLARLGQAISTRALGPPTAGSFCEAAAEVSEKTELLPQVIDHVPIPA